MNKAWIGLGLCGLLAAGGVTVVAQTAEERVRNNVFVGEVPVGGLTPDQARFRLRVWWESRRRQPIPLQLERNLGKVGDVTPTQLGVVIDDEGIVADLPRSGLAEQVTGSQEERLEVAVRYRRVPVDSKPLLQRASALLPAGQPASVRLVNDQLVVQREVAGMTVVGEALSQLTPEEIAEGKPITLPVKEAPKRFPDEELAKLREVVSEFTTKFPARNRPRSENIRLASGKLTGLLLAPGDRLSFNETVGRRTIERGFREAGVYVNGRHDTGVGGGICQVSTTFYNAALMADLAIIRRTNHSLPVPYVPLGRDASVSYGSLDLVVENSLDHPIAIFSLYQPGKLTYRVYGTKTPGKTIEILAGPRTTRPRGEKLVPDATLAPGRRKVIEKGSTGYSLSTTRIVRINGQEVRRDALGRSSYLRVDRVIAVGTGGPSSPSGSSSGATAPSSRS